MSLVTVIPGGGGLAFSGQKFTVPAPVIAAGANLFGVAIKSVLGGDGGGGGFTPTIGPTPDQAAGFCEPTAQPKAQESRRFKLNALGQLCEIKTRRRRRRLLSCSDKADIAFLTGNLGKGQIAGAAISSVLSRCG